MASAGRIAAATESIRVYECVVIDVNTQCDLCLSDGAYPVANCDTLIPALRRVVAWTKRNHVPVVSSVESHRPWELAASDTPTTCCVDGTDGQRKVAFTIFAESRCIEVDNTLAVAGDLFSRCQQVIFRKRSGDLLENPKADRFLTQLPAKEFIIFGVGFECSIKALALSLLARHKKVTIVDDACGYWNAALAELARRQVCAKGATLTTIDELLQRKLDRRHRYRVAIRPASAAGQHKGSNPTNGTGQRNGRLAFGGEPSRTRRPDGKPRQHGS